MPTPTFENVLLRKRNAKVGVGESAQTLSKSPKIAQIPHACQPPLLKMYY
jgi:hypothetical protein